MILKGLIWNRGLLRQYIRKKLRTCVYSRYAKPTLIEATGVETSSYRIGLPSLDAPPTVFKAYFPPDCRIEAHTHACDYSEIILEGTQKVSGKWLYPGDIRIGLANRGYGPLIAGPEGVTVLVIFADGHWPAVTIGKGDGSTLGTGELLDRFSAADET